MTFFWTDFVAGFYLLGFVLTGIVIISNRQIKGVVAFSALTFFCFVWPFMWLKAFFKFHKKAA